MNHLYISSSPFPPSQQVLNIIREILNRAPPSQNADTRAVLLALPNMTPEILADLERALAEKQGEKDQKGAIKRLLLGADGGLGLLKALLPGRVAAPVRFNFFFFLYYSDSSLHFFVCSLPGGSACFS